MRNFQHQFGDDPDPFVESLLNWPLAEFQLYERTEFERLCGGYSEIVLYGAGNLGRKTLGGLRAEGIEPLGFTDGNATLWGAEVCGLPVLPPVDAAARWGKTATFVICTFSPGPDRAHATIAQRLLEQGARNTASFIPLYWKYAERFLPHYRIDLPSKVVAAAYEVARAYELVDEARSRFEFAEQLYWLTAPEFLALPVESPDSEFYFPIGLFDLTPAERFVDCGAFDGDTLTAFLRASRGQFAHVDCFEPDPANFAKLSALHARLRSGVRERVALHRTAVGEADGMVRFDSQGSLTAAVSETGDIEVPVVPLDSAAAGPTYIKMDLEGFEPQALAGARGVISRGRPKLAVSAYHRQEHLWSLLLQIESYSAGGYDYYFRRYGDQFGDVVCYAVPKA